MYRCIQTRDETILLKRIVSTVIAALGLLPGAASAWAHGVPSIGFAAGGTGMTPFYVIGFELGPWGWLRLPFQLVLIAWAIWVTKPPRDEE